MWSISSRRMELYLKRTYFPEGCNGAIFWQGQMICASIELPWKDNQREVSCIPEGRYPLVKRYSPKFKWHLWVKEVKGRSLILMHPANDAQKELRGCIAPVSLPAIVTSIGGYLAVAGGAMTAVSQLTTPEVPAETGEGDE